uniref:Uncharacterized protein n=1 Tax=Trichogramma kaykai TaxID=54128 RepID=A0ABD2W4M4_9HYME
MFSFSGASDAVGRVESKGRESIGQEGTQAAQTTATVASCIAYQKCRIEEIVKTRMSVPRLTSICKMRCEEGRGK